MPWCLMPLWKCAFGMHILCLWSSSPWSWLHVKFQTVLWDLLTYLSPVDLFPLPPVCLEKYLFGLFYGLGKCTTKACELKARSSACVLSGGQRGLAGGSHGVTCVPLKGYWAPSLFLLAFLLPQGESFLHRMLLPCSASSLAPKQWRSATDWERWNREPKSTFLPFQLIYLRYLLVTGSWLPRVGTVSWPLCL